MLKRFGKCRRGGAAIEHALMLSVLALLLVGGVAAVGDKLRPQLVAWKEKPVGIDQTLTGSITRKEGDKTYRVYYLPEGLKPANRGREAGE